MTNKELDNSTVAEVAGDETRRSFMKGIVAGSVAAGTLAATVANAAPTQFAAAPSAVSFLAKARPETAKLKVSFDQRRLPKLYDVQKALEDILRRSGCPNCGLGGIDILLRLDELINPAENFVAVVEGSILQG
jgi:anaerobic selenocysteine-containing dehydrogenase